MMANQDAEERELLKKALQELAEAKVKKCHAASILRFFSMRSLKSCHLYLCLAATFPLHSVHLCRCRIAPLLD